MWLENFWIIEISGQRDRSLDESVQVITNTRFNGNFGFRDSFKAFRRYTFYLKPKTGYNTGLKISSAGIFNTDVTASDLCDVW